MDSQLQIEITCQLCRRLAKEPSLLDCLHSFCRTCIEIKLKKGPPTPSDDYKDVVCPVCTHVTNISTTGGNEKSGFLTGNLRKNVVAERILLNIRQNKDLDADEGLVIFGNGHEGNGQHTLHGKSSKVVYESETRPLINGDYRSSICGFERCVLHDGELKKYFCKTCRIPLCASCVILEHGKKAHEWTTLSEAADGLKEELNGILLEAESRLETVDVGISELEQKIEKVPVRMKAFRDEIAEACGAAIKKFTEYIEKKRLLLLERIRELEKSSVEDIERSRKEGQVIHAKLSRVAEYGHNVMTQDYPTEILEWNGSLLQSLEDIPVHDWSEQIHTSGEAALDPELRFRTGSTWAVCPASGWCPLGELLRPGGWKLVSTVKIDRPLGDLVTAIAVLEDGNTVIGYQMSGVCVVDPRGNQTSICKDVGRTVDLAPMCGGKLAVLNTRSVVNIVQFKGQVTELQLDGDHCQRLRCLAATPDGVLVAGIVKQKKICILGHNGSLDDTILTTQKAHRLAVSSGHIAMVHDPAIVFIIDMKGNAQCTIHEDDWAYASVCSSGTGDFFVLSARKCAPKLLTIGRYSAEGRLKDVVAADYPISTLGWLNPRISSAGGRVMICAEDELITFEREVLVLDDGNLNAG